MQEKMVRAREEDLGLLEIAAEQIEKAKKGSLEPEEYGQAARTLGEIKEYLKNNEISEQDYADFFGSKRPFYVANSGEEFYVTRKRTLFTRRNFKAYRSFGEPEKLVFANSTQIPHSSRPRLIN